MPGRSKSCQALMGLVLLCCTVQAARGQATLSLTSPPCANTNTLVVNLDLTQTTTKIAVGAQVFLQYDNVKLQFVSAVPGDAPYTFEVFESVDTGAGTIDYAVGIASPGTGVAAPPTRTMARFTFTILPGAEACTVSNLMSFRATGPNGALNRVSDDQFPNQPILPLTLNNLPNIRIDQTAPTATSTGPIDPCYDTVAEAEADALANSSATDNCTTSPAVSVQTTGTCNVTVTVSFADECGNIATIPYTTKIDGQKPTITCPTDIIVTANTNQCDAVVNYPAPLVNDNCDPAPTVTCSIPSGSVFLPGTTPVTCTAEDSCGHVSDPCSFNVTVNLLPTTLTLASTGCQPNGQLVVEVNMSNACKIVVGGQYFLQYDTTRLQFVSAVPGDAPFTKEVFEFVNTGLGTIDYATGIQDGGTGTSAPTTMARITFNVILDDCGTTNLITWRPSGPGGIPNRLSDDQVPAQPILPLAVVNLPSVTLDITDPVIANVPSNTTVECDAVPAGAPSLPASDNCDLSITQATLNPDQISPGPCPQSYTITRTWSATDACGNSALATQIITVQDTTAPTVDPAPGPVTISCETPLPTAPPTLPASDNCDPTVTAATLNADQTTPGSCSGNYTVTRTWTATDACGNSTMRTQIITVQDITPPTIDCPSDTTVQCTSLVPPADFAGGGTADNCGNTPNVVALPDAVSNQTCPNRYTITRTYVATDDCGNTAACSQTITVDDTTPPTISCPGTVTVQCAALVPAADFAGGSASDNCGGTPTVNHVGDSISNMECPNRYTITRTYLATDACGNTNTCSQTINVDDTTAPIITLNGPAEVHLQCNSGNYVEQGATWSDNCDGGPFAVTSITYTPSMPTNQNGVYTVHYNAVDACGNPAVEVTRTVIIENPTPTCNSPQPLTVTCQCPNACVPATHPAIAAWLLSAAPVDGCDNDAVIESNDAPACFPIGTTTVTWTVTDRDQVPPVPNTCSSTVTIVADTTAPTASQGSIATCYATVADANQAALNATATLDDDCDPMNAGLTVTKSVFTSATEACATSIVIRVQDACGNFTDYTYSTRVDNTPPSATQGVINACYQNVAAANAAAIAATTALTDNCDVNNVGGTVTKSLLTSASVACSTSVVVRVQDFCGNFSDYTYPTRVDNTAPSASSSGPIAACYQTVAAAQTAALANSSATDNCPGALTPTATPIPDVGCNFDIFVDFADSCGNTSNFLIYSTRIDNLPPTATQGSIAACYPSVAAANAAALAATTNLIDNCTPPPTKAIHTSATEACSTSIVVRVTDACGLFTDYTYNTRVDSTPPTATQGSIAACYQTAAAANAAALAATTALTDNCDPSPVATIHTSASVACSTSIVVRVTDSCGNFTDYTYNTRVDNTAPSATQGTIDACYHTVAAANAAALAATTDLTDNCDPTPGKAIHTSAIEACSTSIVVRVSDSCGNFTDYTYNTRVDGTAPTITLCPSDMTVHAAAGSCTSAPVTYGAAAATDNCTASGNINISFSPPSGSTFTPGTHTVTVTATDECGNSSQCTFSVTNDGQTEVSVEVELGGGVMANGSFTRGITFALWNTGVDNVNPLFTTCVTMTFSGDFPVAKTATATFLAPCQPTGYDCITGRDRLHTLRRTISPIPVTGQAYTPSFTVAKALIGGNLNDDRFIDILDFGIYTTQDLTLAPGGANTVCGQNPPLVKHADITGNGLVNSLDYSFIANNFLMARENNCNGSPITVVAADGNGGARERDRPVTSITIAELHQQGLGELAVMDLNHDGVFDLVDKQLWGQGVRPTPAPPSAPAGGKPVGTGQRVQPQSIPLP